jgi:hypothetical protein
MRSVYHFSGIICGIASAIGSVNRTKLPRYHNT